MQINKLNYGCLIYTIIALGFIIIGAFHLNCNSNPEDTDKNERTYMTRNIYRIKMAKV